MTRRLVIVPLYNEEKHIQDIIDELRRHYLEDLLVVNDGSKDRSRQILDSIVTQSFSVIHHPENRGYGASLITGFEHAIRHNYDQVVTMDADWQHEPCCVNSFFAALSDCDVVSGSRYLREQPGDSEAPADRLAINREITVIINSITSYGLSDTFCGFKALRVPALKKLLLGERGYAFPLQFWIQAWHHGLKVKELPVPRIYLDASRSFGEVLNDPKVRLAHYKEVISNEVERWKPT
ncbi:MAG: glycosyltransferase family 2 protein, partial [Proteobacteria bacterium]